MARNEFAAHQVHQSHSGAEAIIMQIAQTQHGLVTRDQLLRAGLSRHVIDRRSKLGLLRALHVGVYQVGPVAPPHVRELAALLACRGGVISYRSAAARREWVPAQQAGDPVDVTLPAHQHCGRRPGIRPHRCSLAQDEIADLDGLQITSAARTLFDLSSVSSARDLERALASAERADPRIRTSVMRLLQRHAGYAGTRALRDLMESAAPAALTRSEAEERLLALIRTSGIPHPEMNVVVRGYEVDCYWRSARLVVEVDGYEYHGSRRAFVRDRQRDSALAAAGIRVLRLSWHQLTNEHERTLVQLAQALVRAEA